MQDTNLTELHFQAGFVLKANKSFKIIEQGKSY